MEDRDTDASAIERNLESYNVTCGMEKRDLEQMLKNEEISACHK